MANCYCKVEHLYFSVQMFCEFLYRDVPSGSLIDVLPYFFLDVLKESIKKVSSVRAF